MGRFLRDPDSYVSAVEAAWSLRDVAEKVELGGGMVRISVQISHATEAEVEDSIRRRNARLGVKEAAHGKPQA